MQNFLEQFKNEIQMDCLAFKSKQEFVDAVQNLFLEGNKGFALVGRRHYMRIDGDNYYLDLLFYHIRLRCYCVVELKSTDFKPEYAGKLNFYLSAVDDFLKHEDDNPSIGILLCKSKNKLKVEYALRDINKPIGVADYGDLPVKKASL